jgi:hypothetical protein
MMGSAEAGLIVMSVNGIAIYLFMNYLAECVVGAPHGEQFATYGRSVVRSTPFLGVLLVVLKVSPTPLAVAVACTAVGCAYYGLLYRKQVRRVMERWAAR